MWFFTMKWIKNHSRLISSVEKKYLSHAHWTAVLVLLACHPNFNQRQLMEKIPGEATYIICFNNHLQKNQHNQLDASVMWNSTHVFRDFHCKVAICYNWAHLHFFVKMRINPSCLSSSIKISWFNVFKLNSVQFNSVQCVYFWQWKLN